MIPQHPYEDECDWHEGVADKLRRYASDIDGRPYKSATMREAASLAPEAVRSVAHDISPETPTEE